MATQNLGNVRALIASNTAPTNTNLLWRDTSVTPPVTKEYDGSTSTWIALRLSTDDFIAVTEKGAINGVATLGMNGRIPSAQLPTGLSELRGTFGSAGSTTGGDLPTAGVSTGHAYVCDTDSYASTVASLTFNEGDFAIYGSDDVWRRIPGSGGVQSNWTETDTDEISYIRNKPFTTVQETRLRTLVYEDATSTLSRNVSIFEKGLTTNTAVTVTWNVVPNDDLITSVTITNLTGPFDNSGSQVANISDTTTWMLTAARTDAEGNSRPSLTNSVTSTAVVPKFYGVANQNTYPTVDPYTTLTKLVQSSSSIAFQTFSPSNQYVWFITTKGTGTIFDGNGFDNTADFTVTQISLALPDATTETAYIYVTNTVKTLTNFQYRLV